MQPFLGALAMICVMVGFIAAEADGFMRWVPFVAAGALALLGVAFA